MKVRTLLIVAALLSTGAGGIFAHDAYQDHQRQTLSETLPPPVTCSTCAAHKADLKNLREYNAQRSGLKEPADPKETE